MLLQLLDQAELVVCDGALVLDDLVLVLGLLLLLLLLALFLPARRREKPLAQLTGPRARGEPMCAKRRILALTRMP